MRGTRTRYRSNPRRHPRSSDFFRSKHVTDLRFIAVSSLYLLVVAVLLFASLGAWAFVRTAFTVWGAVLAWAYLAASARLGIVEASVGEGSTGPLSIVRKLAAAWSGMRGKLKRAGWDDAFLAQLLAVFCRAEVR